ncbi:hypothetical protein [Celeribacter arenosi]|uniref:Uncharacterized protein n=1 Tax=Celeribacter arenosi TaxID=792649 RepID=A0ABP7K0A4_9RHOB
MSDAYDIPEGHERLVWVFAVDAPVAEIEPLVGAGLGEVLGLWREPDPAHVECVDASTLNNYGVARYVAEANGMDVGDDAPMLDALSGTICLVFSKALGQDAARFAPEPPFRLVGRYGAPVTIPSMDTLRSESAQGLLPQGKPPASPARISGMVATFVLLFLAVFVAVFVWIAG